MKPLLLLTLLLCTTFQAGADQRFETGQGLCHFAYDANDVDNEVYFSNCISTITTEITPLTQGVRYTAGTSISKQYYIMKYGTYPGVLDTRLKGSDANALLFPDPKYTLAANTPCVMVTSNYNAGNDDDNETVYVTNDWNLEIKASGYVPATDTMLYTYTLNCRKGAAQ